MRHNPGVGMIVKAVDLGRSSPDDSFQSQNNFVYRYFLDAIFVVGFGIRLVPPVSRGFLISGADKRKIPVGIRLSLSRHSRVCGFPQARYCRRAFFPLMMIFF